MNDHRTKSPALVLCASSRVSACAEGPEAILRSRSLKTWHSLVAVHFQVRSSPSDWSPRGPRLERAARPAETTQSGGGVMMPIAPKFRPSPRQTPDAWRSKPPGDDTRAIMPWDSNTRRPWSHLVNSQAAAVGHVGRRLDGRTAQPQPQRERIFCFSRGRRASHRIRTTGQDQMKTARKKSEGCQVAPASSAPRSLLAYFGMSTAASPIKARQSRSVPGGGPARIPDEPGSSHRNQG